MLVKAFHGVGYPSASRQVRKFHWGTSDPNGYYRILGLSPTCSPKEIKDKYHELSKKYHPDGEEPDVEKFRQINEIYKVLSDNLLRQEYNSIDSESNEIFIGNLEKEKLFDLARQRGVPLSSLVESATRKSPTRDPDLPYHFIADDESRRDLAQQWYVSLRAAAYHHRYEGTLRVGVCPLGQSYKITSDSHYLIFWFDPGVPPNWALAHSAFCVLNGDLHFSSPQSHAG